MNTSTFRNAKYAALGETWCRHQTARILSRHLQFGKHCRLDLDALLAGIARMLRPEIPDGMPSEIDCRRMPHHSACLFEPIPMRSSRSRTSQYATPRANVIAAKPSS